MSGSVGRLARVYVDQSMVERLNAAYVALMAELGRVMAKADVLTAIVAVGLEHREEVAARLRSLEPS